MANTHGTVDFTSSTAVVIYDRQSGAIVHVHECWTERGGRPPGKRTLHAEALHYAREERPDIMARAMAALHVDPKALVVSAGESLRVDVQRRELTRVKAPAKRLRAIAASSSE